MLRLMILGTITMLMMKALHGWTMETGPAVLPEGYAVAAVNETGLDSSYILPEMVITAPRIVDGDGYSPERYRYGRTYMQSVSRRLIRIAGYMIVATLTVTWIILAISRIPHIHRIRNKKRHHLSYLYMARMGRGRKI